MTRSIYPSKQIYPFLSPNPEYFGIRLVNALLLLRAELTDTYRVIYSCSQTVPIVTGFVGEVLKSLHRVLLPTGQ